MLLARVSAEWPLEQIVSSQRTFAAPRAGLIVLKDSIASTSLWRSRHGGMGLACKSAQERKTEKENERIRDWGRENESQRETEREGERERETEIERDKEWAASQRNPAWSFLSDILRRKLWFCSSAATIPPRGLATGSERSDPHQPT
ncbi:hypothetical protein AOLI_G00105560 [Acnodon oligacanthus]